MLVHGQHWRKEARLLVLAAGAWSGLIPGLPPSPCARCAARCCCWAASSGRGAAASGRGFYAVRRGATGLLVGATVEEAGFDKHNTVEGIEDLLAFARRLLPGIGQTRLETVWAGLRPGTPDGLPILREAPGWPRARRHRPLPQRHPARPLDGAGGGAAGLRGEGRGDPALLAAAFPQPLLRI